MYITMYIDWLLQPLSIIAIMFVITLVTWIFAGAKPVVPFICFCLSLLVFLVSSMPATSNAFVHMIENDRQNPAFCIADLDAPMVVLGGGIDLHIDGDSPYEILNPDSLVRTLRATEFASADTQYYLMGGGGAGRTLADNMKSVLVDFGVPSENITLDGVSYSTYQNAVALTELLPNDDNPIIQLATSKLHNKRAAATFEKAGYRVCQVNVDTIYSEPVGFASLMPYLSGLQKNTVALHEWMAQVVYRYKGFL